MRPEVVRSLRCPVCRDPLSLSDGSRGPLRCPRGHSFDQARQGYVQLAATPLAHAGDSPAMVAARQEFLNAGHYAMITEALGRAASAYHRGGLIFDLGAGPGHHLAGVLNALPPETLGLAADVSKPAVRAAARSHPHADAIVCDAWQPLPIADATIGVALDVFAPRPGAEFARILRPDGVLLVVTPTAEHLAELIEPLDLLHVDPAKGARVEANLGSAFSLEEQESLGSRMNLSHADVATLVGMGPSAWHTDLTRIGTLPDPVDVTASVTLSVYRPVEGWRPTR